MASDRVRQALTLPEWRMEAANRWTSTADPDEPRATAERALMLELQRAMLPTGLPVLPDLSLAAEYHPADLPGRAGGDWFEVVPMPRDMIGLAVGDVVGHGPMASAVMGQLRAVTAERLQRGSGLEDVLMALDAFAAGSPAARGGTLCLAVLDRRSGSVRYAVCGHPPPLVVGRDGTTRYLSGSAGSPLAMLRGSYHAAADVLAAGDTLVLYSDGAVGRPGRTLAQGLSELAGHVGDLVRGTASGSASGERSVAEAVCSAVSAGPPGAVLRPDDVSVVAATVLAQPAQPLTLSVAATPDRLSVVRESFAGWLAGLRSGEDDLLALELSVVEAVTNSIEHAFAGTPGTVRVEASLDWDGSVNVAVSDDGRWRPPRQDPGFRGRGLIMMREFTDSLRLSTAEDGTTVTLTKALRRPVFAVGGLAPRVRHPGEPEISINVEVGPDSVTVSVAGVVDSTSIDELHACLIDVERRGWLPLTIVLDEVTLLASAGLRTLYEHAGTLLSVKRGLRLVAADSSPARDVLAVSGLDKLVEVHPTVPQRDVG